MTTSVSTGGYSSSVSRYDFDYEALIEAAVESKLSRATTYEDKITVNETKISAYEELQSLLLTFQESAQALRSPTGTTESADDVFLDRTAYLYSSSSTSATTLMEATVEEGTEIGTHSVIIEQIAATEKLGSKSVSSRDEALGLSGTFTLAAEDGTATGIAITSDMTLEEIVEAIDSVSETTGVDASVIKVDDDNYMLVLTATNTGQDITITDTGGVMTSLGVLKSDGSFANELQANQNAILTVDGVTVQRESNEIDDVIDGVTLQLYSADEDTTLTLETAADLTAIEDAVTAFVEAYNALREFIITNQTVTSSGTASEDAVLFGDSTLRSITSAVSTILSDSSGGYSLADIGIEFDSSNNLTLDTDVLESALVTDLEAIETLFGYQCSVSDTDLAILSHDDNTQESLSFTLDIKVATDGTVTASVGGNSSLFTVDGSVIEGAEGTIYEGLKFVYASSSSQSIDVEINQGLADRLYAAIETVADSSDGTLTELVNGLEETNTDLETRINTITEAASRYEEFLTEKYARIEAKLAEAESILAVLDAYTNSSDD